MTNAYLNKFNEVEIVKSIDNTILDKDSSDKFESTNSTLTSTTMTNAVLKKSKMNHYLVHLVNFYQF